MVNRFLGVKEAVTTVLSSNRDTSHLAPKWQDMDILEALDKAISPLSTFTDILSGDSYITSSAMKPTLSRLAKEELAGKQEDLPLTVELKEKILQKLEARYSVNDNDDEHQEEMNLLFDTTCFLDPRYKVIFQQTVNVFLLVFFLVCLFVCFVFFY